MPRTASKSPAPRRARTPSKPSSSSSPARAKSATPKKAPSASRGRSKTPARKEASRPRSKTPDGVRRSPRIRQRKQTAASRAVSRSRSRSPIRAVMSTAQGARAPVTKEWVAPDAPPSSGPRFFFWLAVFAGAVFAYFHSIDACPEWTIYAKPLPSLVLIPLAQAFREQGGGGEGFDRVAYLWWLSFGLLFSAAGDVLLALDHRYFLSGVIAFALAHICYSAAFSSGFVMVKPYRGIVPFGFAAAVLYHVSPHVPQHLQIVVAIYGVFIASMAWRAFARVGYRAQDVVPELFGVAGAILFIASDTLLAMRDFGHRASLYDVPISTAVMVTYFAAQFLIALSVPSRTKGNFSIY